MSEFRRRSKQKCDRKKEKKRVRLSALFYERPEDASASLIKPACRGMSVHGRIGTAYVDMLQLGTQQPTGERVRASNQCALQCRNGCCEHAAAV